jgi:hypothetical protein
MTALEIIRDLKKNRKNVLWINEDRREAAHLTFAGGRSITVSFGAAMIAKSDPAINVHGIQDGTIYAAI